MYFTGLGNLTAKYLQTLELEGKSENRFRRDSKKMRTKSSALARTAHCTGCQ